MSGPTSPTPSRTDPSTTFDWTAGALAEGLLHYNAQLYFTAHEEWESVWLHLPQPQKTFLQALIQVTVAFHHLRRNNSLGATRLLTAALRKLEACPANFGGINTALLCDDLRACLEISSAAGLASTHPAPRICPLSL